MEACGRNSSPTFIAMRGRTQNSTIIRRVPRIALERLCTSPETHIPTASDKNTPFTSASAIRPNCPPETPPASTIIASAGTNPRSA